MKVERKTLESFENTQLKPERKRQQQAATHNIENRHEDNPLAAAPANQKPKLQEYKPQDEVPKEKKQFVLVVNHKDADNQESHLVQKPEPTHYVPYESGAGVRQHHQAKEETAAASVPRLFLEPSTGHVVDRATGQAYVLQPITKYN